MEEVFEADLVNILPNESVEIDRLLSMTDSQILQEIQNADLDLDSIAEDFDTAQHHISEESILDGQPEQSTVQETVINSNMDEGQQDDPFMDNDDEWMGQIDELNFPNSTSMSDSMSNNAQIIGSAEIDRILEMPVYQLGDELQSTIFDLETFDNDFHNHQLLQVYDPNPFDSPFQIPTSVSVQEVSEVPKPPKIPKADNDELPGPSRDLRIPDNEVPGPSRNVSVYDDQVPEPLNQVRSLIDKKSREKMYKKRICPLCKAAFRHRYEIDYHLHKIHKEYFNNTHDQTGSAIHIDESDDDMRLEIKSEMFQKYITAYEVNLKDRRYIDVVGLFQKLWTEMRRVILEQLEKHKSIQVFFHLQYLFSKDEETEEIRKWITSYGHGILHESMIGTILLTIRDKIVERIENYCEKQSNLNVEKIENFEMIISKKDTFAGGSYLPLPYLLTQKRGCILNIDNSEESLELDNSPEKSDDDDKKCFLWSVLAGMNKRTVSRSSFETVAYYRKYAKDVNTEGIDWPMTISQLAKFERQDPKLSITVLGYDPYDENNAESAAEYNRILQDTTISEANRNKKRRMKISDGIREKLYPLYYSKVRADKKDAKKVDLMLIMKEDVAHFVLIKDLSKLLYRPSVPWKM